MLINEIKAIDSSRKTLRNFGLTLGIVFAVLAVFVYWRHHDYLPLVITASFFFALGFLMPEWLKPIQIIWMTLGLIMGWVMTRVILCSIYYIIITPIAFIAKLSGHNFLRLSQSKNQDSYWVESNITRTDLENYKQQF